jgi:hypothetical protein
MWGAHHTEKPTSRPLVRHCVQIQAELGEGHVNLVQAKELVLSRSHLVGGARRAAPCRGRGAVPCRAVV